MTSGTHDLLRQLYVTGAEVSLTETNTVRITGQSVPKGLITPLREQKQEIIQIMEAQGVGRNEDGLNSPVPRRYVVPPACLSSRVCARLGPCSRSLMRHGCVRMSDDCSGTATDSADNRAQERHEVELQHVGS